MPFRNRLRSSMRLQFLVNCPDMTADRAAKKPALNPKLLGERQYASLNIPTLRACKRARGHIESHIDEEVGTHDESPFSTAARHAPSWGRRQPITQDPRRMCGYSKNVPRQRCQLRSRDDPSCARALAARTASEPWLTEMALTRGGRLGRRGRITEMMLPRMLAVGTKERLCPESLEYLDRVDGLTGGARRPVFREVVRLIHARRVSRRNVELSPYLIARRGVTSRGGASGLSFGTLQT